MSKEAYTDLTEANGMFLSELSPDIEKLLDRHNAHPKTFYPYDVVDAMDEAIERDGFIPEDAPIDPVLTQALHVNLLTEDGLPYYTATLLRDLPPSHPFRDWIYQWTAEEGRHGPTIANWMYKSGQVDMHEIEDSRMAMMRHPDTPQPESFVESIIYPSIQEPATEVSHRNTLKQLPTTHKIGRKAISEVVGDEVKHGNFYKDLTLRAIEVNPSLVVIGLERQIKTFAMPGKSIPGFDEKSKEIAKAGIFNLEELRKIYGHLIDFWKIEELDGLSEEAERSRVYITKRMVQIDKILDRQREKSLSEQAS